MRLLSLVYTHLQIDGVSHDVHFRRLQVIEEVTVVPVVVSHGILVFAQSLVEQLLVVDVALLHAEHTAEVVCGEHGVSHPRDIADIVFLSFVYLDIYVHVLRVVCPHAVVENLGVAVAQLIVFVDELLFAFLVALRRELGGLHEA